ncbi:hypothetical protein GCM10027360_94000 [Amycolatopsis echigonensis]
MVAAVERGVRHHRGEIADRLSGSLALDTYEGPDNLSDPKPGINRGSDLGP